MEVEVPLDLVNSCNFARKRQAAMESYTETRSKKRPCLADSSWCTEIASNMETENRLFPLHCTQPMFAGNPQQGYNQPLSHDYSALYNHQHMDINCNLTSCQVNDTQQMNIACDSALIRSQHQQNFQSPMLLLPEHPPSASCYRCLRGEPGHINHLSS